MSKIDISDEALRGRYIRALRVEMGLTQRQLADGLKVSVSTVSRWERGFWIPPHYAQVLTLGLYAEWQKRQA